MIKRMKLLFCFLIASTCCLTLVNSQDKQEATGPRRQQSNTVFEEITAAEIVGFVLIPIVAGLCNAGGFAGTEVLMPIAISLFRHNPIEAVRVVYAMGPTAAIGNTVLRLIMKTPKYALPVINYDIVMICIPLQIMGWKVGLIVRTWIPTMIPIIVLFFTSVILLISLFKRVKFEWKKRNREKEGEEESKLSKPASPKKDTRSQSSEVARIALTDDQLTKKDNTSLNKTHKDGQKIQTNTQIEAQTNNNTVDNTEKRVDLAQKRKISRSNSNTESQQTTESNFTQLDSENDASRGINIKNLSQKFIDDNQNNDGVIIVSVHKKVFSADTNHIHESHNNRSTLETTLIQERLSKVLRRERRTLPWEIYLYLITTLVASFLLEAFRGSNKFRSAIKIPYCSPGYWLIWVANVPVLLLCYAWALVLVHRRKRLRHTIGNEKIEKELSAFNKPYIGKVSVIAFIAGIVAGLVGTGGGIVLSPILLSYGMETIRATSTASMLSFLTSLTPYFNLMISHDVPYKDVGVFMGLTFFGSAVIANTILSLATRYNMKYILPRILFIILIVLVFYTVGWFIYMMISNAKGYAKFNTMCPTRAVDPNF